MPGALCQGAVHRGGGVGAWLLAAAVLHRSAGGSAQAALRTPPPTCQSHPPPPPPTPTPAWHPHPASPRLPPPPPPAAPACRRRYARLPQGMQGGRSFSKPLTGEQQGILDGDLLAAFAALPRSTQVAAAARAGLSRGQVLAVLSALAWMAVVL